ncbi:PREDICTED: uncharacterized protein LOC104809601 [Tarenaya hassleriana]|uniref:uncharacterized protein LOC104809601 n=1 Tax=Tarenaya hassleriana TaxID=28532 RepID=UPI00053C8047|nr:PREDICTED: uncharacterized protein LOC104809601 [Tarenaya hassleriana]
MAADTTAPIYWLNWRVFLCALVLLFPLTIAAILIWRYEGVKRRGRERRESQREPTGTVFEDEAWNTCLKGIHPTWLLAYRVFAFVAMSALLISNVVRDGGGIFYFYTEWTFTLVTLYFGYASSLSIYGCFFIHDKEDGRNMESYTSTDAAEQGVYGLTAIDEAVNISKASDTCEEVPLRKTAGLWVYIFQVVFQTCAGAVVLTDIVFWLLLYPFTKGSKLSFLAACMHSLNAVFLLGDTALNALRFPLFRIAYFVLWSVAFMMYQWIVHAFNNIWWPYQFLDLSSRYAPLWYLGVGVMHLPCYGLFALIFKLKNNLLQRLFPESYRGP